MEITSIGSPISDPMLADWFLHPKTMVTERLIIRSIQLDDSVAIHEFKSDPDFTRCYGQEPKRSIEETRKWVERNLADQQKGGSITWAITLKDGEQVIGDCCYWNFDEYHRCGEIGYEIHPSHSGKGFMTEALTAVISFGFDELHLHRIEANPLADNQRSCNVLRKLGFREEGVLRERVRYRDQYLDQVYFGLLKKDWSGRTARQ